MRIKQHLVPLLPLFAFAFLVFSAHIDTERLTGTRDAYLSFAILQLLAFVLPAIFYCKAKGVNDIFRLKMRLFGLEKAVFLLFSVMVMICAVTAVELLLRNFGISDGLYAHSVYTIYGRTLPELGGNVYDTMYTLIVFALLPALTEEFLFRSVLYTEYEHLGAPAAIVLTAFASSFLDMSAVAFIPSFVGGLLLGFSVYVTQSVFAPFVIHVLYNLYALFFEEYIWAFIAKPENEVFFTFVLITLLLFCAVMMLSQAERVIYDKGIRGEPLPEYLRAYAERRGGKLPSSTLGILRSMLSPAYLICILLFALRVAGIV
ncbi:MAG: CPBP family intramembrane metalloprotease [Oscillospiraceae bacterium]|nr:CPBP family intramembrane metalloprotease [Oscillospiraceae bacterium]